MRIAIFGCGAVGGYFGARLAEAGADVCFIARGATYQALKTKGLELRSPRGDYLLATPAVYASAADAGEVDLVLLCTKAWSLEQAACELKPMLGSGTFIVPLQNGVESPQRLQALLEPERILGGLCYIFAEQSAPGVITHNGSEVHITFGELNNQTSARAQALEASFKHCQGLEVHLSLSIQQAMWEKFLAITSISGLGALLRMPVGVIRGLSGTRELMFTCMREVQALAKAHGVELQDSMLERISAQRDRAPYESTTSLQRDIISGRPSELHWQTGAVVRLAEQTGVSVPVSKLIYTCLLPSELKSSGQLEAAVQHEFAARIGISGYNG
jgi:2-dehydropantoate 2-reductase